MFLELRDTKCSSVLFLNDGMAKISNILILSMLLFGRICQKLYVSVFIIFCRILRIVRHMRQIYLEDFLYTSISCTRLIPPMMEIMSTVGDLP